jgi:SAM-dependent methyltransferase
LPERQDVQRFKNFIVSNVDAGKVLDVGCGILPMPGYLDFPDKNGFELVGLDPIDDRSFQGLRVVGCSEFTPFLSESFDALVYATSLDHVCCLDHTLIEAYRLLKPGGKVLIWMSDRRRNLKERIAEIVDSWQRWKERRTNRRGYREGRFVVFPNYTVLYTPRGAVDPFHSYLESPDYVSQMFIKHGFALGAEIQNCKDEVFLCFRKGTTK